MRYIMTVQYRSTDGSAKVREFDTMGAAWDFMRYLDSINIKCGFPQAKGATS